MSEAQPIEVPPRPEEILDEDRIAYQAMSDLSDEDYVDLAEDIQNRGVLQAILIDENDTILDGHHREAITQHYELSGSKAPSYLRLGDLEDDDKKLARAIKMNLLGRDTNQGVKADAVEQYITRAWTTDDETGALVRHETDSEVADKLGVSQQLVSRVVKDTNHSIIYHDRVKAREYYRDNPDASYREVAEQVEASRPTVTEWLKEDFDEGDDVDEDDDTEQQPLNMLARNQSEVEQTRELANRVRDEDEDDDVSEVAQEEAEKVAAGETTPDRANTEVERHQEREEKREQIDETPEVPDGEYEVLLADPPWQYDHQQSPNRDIENHYLTMSLSEIKDMDVPAADNAVLYLWTTAPKLEEAFGVLDAWGFEYTTCAVWDKQKIGMGYWFRGQHELILVAKNGSFSPPEPEDRVSSVISEPRGEHSEKPDALHELIEEAFPNRSKLELFARDARDGWDSWGDEV